MLRNWRWTLVANRRQTYQSPEDHRSSRSPEWEWQAGRLLEFHQAAEPGRTSSKKANDKIRFKRKRVRYIRLGEKKVSIRTPSNKHLTLKVYPLDTVEQLKARIQLRTRISADEQILLINGTLPQDHWTMADCNLQKRSLLQLRVRMRGGAKKKSSRCDCTSGNCKTCKCAKKDHYCNRDLCGCTSPNCTRQEPEELAVARRAEIQRRKKDAHAAFEAMECGNKAMAAGQSSQPRWLREQITKNVQPNI